MSAPPDRGAWSVWGVEKPQILTIRDMVSRLWFGPKRRARAAAFENRARTRVLQRRALLVSPSGAKPGARLGGWKTLRIGPGRRHRAAAKLIQLEAVRAGVGLTLS